MKGLILTTVLLLAALLSLRMAWAESLRTGTWSGYYLYSPSLNPHSVHQTMDLTFKDGEVSGSGKDDEIGTFSIQGGYSEADGSIRFFKSYPDHIVMYVGKMSSQTIKGTWALKTCATDGRFELEGPTVPFKAQEPLFITRPPSSPDVEHEIPWQAPRMIEYNKVLPPTPPESPSDLN
jgi:hypothetical protein